MFSYCCLWCCPRALLGEKPVFRIFLATDVALSGVAIIINTTGVTLIIVLLKQRACKSTVGVLLI